MTTNYRFLQSLYNLKMPNQIYISVILCLSNANFVMEPKQGPLMKSKQPLVLMDFKRSPSLQQLQCFHHYYHNHLLMRSSLLILLPSTLACR